MEYEVTLIQEQVILNNRGTPVPGFVVYFRVPFATQEYSVKSERDDPALIHQLITERILNLKAIYGIDRSTGRD